MDKNCANCNIKLNKLANILLTKDAIVGDVSILGENKTKIYKKSHCL